MPAYTLNPKSGKSGDLRVARPSPRATSFGPTTLSGFPSLLQPGSRRVQRQRLGVSRGFRATVTRPTQRLGPRWIQSALNPGPRGPQPSANRLYPLRLELATAAGPMSSWEATPGRTSPRGAIPMESIRMGARIRRNSAFLANRDAQRCSGVLRSREAAPPESHYKLLPSRLDSLRRPCFWATSKKTISKPPALEIHLQPKADLAFPPST